MDLNKLVEAGVLAVIEVDAEVNLDIFSDIDDNEGYGGADMIVLEEERIIITKPELVDGIEDMLERAK